MQLSKSTEVVKDGHLAACRISACSLCATKLLLVLFDSEWNLPNADTGTPKNETKTYLDT